MFTNPLLLIAGILAMGLVFVFAPVFIDAYRKYRFRKVVTCPQTHGLAEVNLKAGRGALAAAVGRPVIRVKNCSLWPKRQGCDENCVAEHWPELH
jgi:hypothetical protein